MAGAFQSDAFQNDAFQGGVAPATGTATWDQAAATWAATASERIAGTATWEQTAAWDAVASESIPSSATWSQDAAWAALGLNAEDVLADATWEQSAASWLAASSQVITGSGTWEQLNVWESTGQSAEDVLAAGTWTQDPSSQTYNDAGTGYNDDIPYNGSFVGWRAVATTSAEVSSGGRRGRRWQPLLPEAVYGTASFVQEPASWRADMTSDRSRADIEELVLVGAL